MALTSDDSIDRDGEDGTVCVSKVEEDENKGDDNGSSGSDGDDEDDDARQ